MWRFFRAMLVVVCAMCHSRRYALGRGTGAALVNRYCAIRTTIATHKQARKKTLTGLPLASKSTFVLQFSVFYLSGGFCSAGGLRIGSPRFRCIVVCFSVAVVPLRPLSLLRFRSVSAVFGQSRVLMFLAVCSAASVVLAPFLLVFRARHAGVRRFQQTHYWVDFLCKGRDSVSL